GRGGEGAESPSGIYIVNVESGQLTRMPSAPQTPGEGRGGRGGGAGAGRGGGRGAAAGGTAPTEPAAGSTARQVAYTANLEVDRKALRSQVFNEGWRIMKNRFYDAKMHGADWAAARKLYEPLLEHLVDTEELQSVM